MTIDYKRIFSMELASIYSERELDNIWRILMEDVFRSEGHAQFDQIIKDLRNNKPVQYITGVQYFFGHQFQVNESVLIPRPETEELVEWVLSEHNAAGLNVLDLGTGSGCIAISIQLARPSWKISALDISPEALKIAAQNARMLGADIDLIEGDMSKASSYSQEVDILICNPPYVLRSDEHIMSASVRAFEPQLALFVDSMDPLQYYREVLYHSRRLSDKTRYLYFEIHEGYSSALQQLCRVFGCDQPIIRKDMQGKDRMARVIVD